MRNGLDMTKFSVWWVSQLLTDEHRTARMGTALEFLSHYHMDGNKFLEQTVTGNETWVNF